MRSQVQVLAGPPAIPPAHGHLGRSSTLPLPARPTGSCQPCATTSDGRVLRTGRRRLDQLVQAGRDGSVPSSHDVLIAQGSGRGGMPHPHHQLPRACARRNRQGGRGVPQVVEAQPLHAGGAGSWDPDPAGEVATADRPTTLGREHQPVRAGLGIDARCSASASAATVGSVTVRMAAPVLVGPKASRPRTSRSCSATVIRRCSRSTRLARRPASSPPAQTGVGRDQHQRPEPPGDGVGQGGDLGHGGKAHLRGWLGGGPRIVQGR
jgi:hypothetical protein